MPTISPARTSWLITLACSHPAKTRRIVDLEGDLAADQSATGLATTRGLQLSIGGELFSASPTEPAETHGHDAMIARLRRSGLEPAAKYLRAAGLFDWIARAMDEARMQLAVSHALSHAETV